MALAWKAGWVHALTSSNLVSSATRITSLEPRCPHRGSIFPGEPPLPRFTSFPQSAGPPDRPARTPASSSSAGLPAQTPALLPSASTTAQASDHKTSATQTPPRFASLPTQTPALRPSASTTAQAFDHKTSATQTPPRFASLPALHQPTRNLLAFPRKRQPYGRPPALQRKRPTARQAFGNWTGARRHPRPLDHPGRSATARAAGTMAATMSSSQAGIGPAPDPRKGRTRP